MVVEWRARSRVPHTECIVVVMGEKRDVELRLYFVVVPLHFFSGMRIWKLLFHALCVRVTKNRLGSIDGIAHAYDPFEIHYLPLLVETEWTPSLGALTVQRQCDLRYWFTPTTLPTVHRKFHMWFIVSISGINRSTPASRAYERNDNV